MLIYLLKASLVWLLMLALYELLYARSRHYFANRTYLLATLFIGALLPLLPLHIWNVDYLQPVRLQPANTAIPSAAATVSEGTAAAPVAFNWHYLLWWMYAAGIAVVLALIIREVIIIIRYAIYGHQKRVGAFKVFETGKQHPPFSFMGWIFIGNKEHYTDEQLDYIIRHEAAHNNRKHWLDILIMQIAVTAFWFHPLIWRLRYHLKMQHEYEADSIASGDNAYDYGHFLLQAAVQQSALLIAHSFFYSPIKNRITMLTKNQKKSTWLIYVNIIPVMVVCIVTMSFKQKQANHNLDCKTGIMNLNGYEILWNRSAVHYDSLLEVNPVTHLTEMKYDINGYQDPDAITLNDEKVVPIIFENKNNRVVNATNHEEFKKFDDYLIEGFFKEFPHGVDGASYIVITNVLIDKKGNIVYYDIITGNEGIHIGEKIPSNEYRKLESTMVQLINRYGKIKLNSDHKGRPVYVDEIAQINFNR